MSSYYSGRRARHYNTRWRTFTKRTLAEALAVIDEARLRRVPEQLGRPPRVLDVACGTGVLLRKVLDRVPDAEAYGVDASADMLAQARAALDNRPHVRLERAEVGAGETAGLPFAPQTFDLITCTNWGDCWHRGDNSWWRITPGVSLLFHGSWWSGWRGGLKRDMCAHIRWRRRGRSAYKRDCMSPVREHSKWTGSGMAGHCCFIDQAALSRASM